MNELDPANRYPRTAYEFHGAPITTEWIRTDKEDEFSPVTQVYGICFNAAGEILVCRSSSTGGWQIPGGTPEGNETLTATLQRELHEEVDIRVSNVQMLGVQRVHYPNNPDQAIGDDFYQARMICDIEEILPSTPDPAINQTWERQFVTQDQVTELVPWGEAGRAMFNDAIKLWQDSRRP